jgi:hypothetical protein
VIKESSNKKSPQKTSKVRISNRFRGFIKGLFAKWAGYFRTSPEAHPKEGPTAVKDFFSMMEKLQGMFESDDVEVITNDGQSVRGRIDNLRSTQPFSKPAVKITSADGKIHKILFADIKDVIDHRKK